jgi:hypothetical protein
MASREHNDGDADRPWTEEQWDDFMKQADLRSARYCELMETLIDHPDREELIDHEMGWDKAPDPADEEWFKQVKEAESEAIAEIEAQDLQEQADAHDGDGTPPRKASPFEETDQALMAIPAYQLSMALLSKISSALKPLTGEEADEDEDVRQTCSQISIVFTKIAAGHAMGYEDEVLGGNVVNCKRALAATVECRVALQSLQSRRVLSPEAVAPLLANLAEVHEAIEQRITELRGKMWWQES